MRSFVSLRLSAHLCFASAMLCMFSPFRENWLLFAALTVLVLIGAYCAAGASRLRDRLLFGLLPVLAFPLASGLPSLLAGIALVGYVCLILVPGRIGEKLWRYRREVKLILILCPVFSLLSIVFVPINSTPTLVFFGLCGLMSILALRALRIGFSNNLRWELGNPLVFVLPTIIGAAVGAFAWLLRPLLEIIMWPIGKVIGVVNALLSKLMALQDEIPQDYPTTEIVSSTTDMTSEVAEPTLDFTQNQRHWILDVNLPWKWIFAAIAGAAILVLVVWLIRRAKKPERSRKADADVLVQTVRNGTETSHRRRRNRRVKLSTNRARIRAVYREYLAYLDQNGVSVRQSDTTAEISDHADPVLLRSDETLRELYRIARYSEAEPDDQTVEEAKAALAVLTAKQGDDAQAESK